MDARQRASLIRNLTDRQRDVFENLDDQVWLRPMDIGGRDASHHTHTLESLIKMGLAERKPRSGLWGSRGSYVYRRTR